MKKITITQDGDVIETHTENTEEDGGIDIYSLIFILISVLGAFPAVYTEAVVRSMNGELQEAEES